MNRIAVVRPHGHVRVVKLFGWPQGAPSWRTVMQHGLPRPGLPRDVFMWRLKNQPNLWRGFWRVAVAKLLGIPCHYGVLYLETVRDGCRVQLGVASLRVVTDAGVNYIRDALVNNTAPAMKYHGFGTGTGAEAVGNTTLGTEFTTEYATDNTRPTGSQATNGTGDYRTVATFAPDSGGTLAVTEHGIFSQAANSGGTLLDRSKFSAVNLVAANGDSLQATYDFVMTSGG